MAFSISIYQSSLNRTYQVTVDLLATVMDKIHGSAVGTGDIDYYLKISTTMRKSNGTVFPIYVVRNLYDLPATSGSYAYNIPALNFTDLIDDYVDYFIYMAELVQSSSSSSISSSSSSFGYSSSSSSSSVGYSSSSSSSTEWKSSSSSSSNSPGP